MTEFGLEEHVLRRIRAALENYPAVERAVIFGSRATGHYKSYSDIDIAVFAPEIDYRDFAMLAFELEELPIIFKIDVVHFDKLSNAALKEKIELEGKTVVEREPLNRLGLK